MLPNTLLKLFPITPTLFLGMQSLLRHFSRRFGVTNVLVGGTQQLPPNKGFHGTSMNVPL